MRALPVRASDLPASTELLQNLKRQDLELVLSAARLRRYSAKSIITHQGEPADHFMLLWKGRARCFFETPEGKKLIQIWITPGHMLGGAALLSRPAIYLVSTEAVRDSVVAVWDGDTIRNLARRLPQILENALIIAANYVSWYVATMAVLTSHNARQKLAHVLLGYAASIGQKTPGGIELDVSNEEVANSANITPYTASRILSEWQKLSLLRKRRGKIVLVSPEKLFARVDQSSYLTFSRSSAHLEERLELAGTTV